MGISFVTAMRSVAGPYRSNNEDAAAASPAFAIVADGVGGHAGGEVASGTVVRHLARALEGADVAALDPDALRALVAEANDALRRQVAERPDLEGMATTLTALVRGDGVLRVVHVGDSRAYRLHGDGERTGQRVTHDDSLVQELVDAGAIRAADAAHHPQRHVILRSLGGDAEDAGDVTVLEVPAVPGDRWLLCSDGLTDELDDDGLLAVAAAPGTAEDAAAALLAAALEADAHDNVTVVVCDVVAEGEAGGSAAVLGAAAPTD